MSNSTRLSSAWTDPAILQSEFPLPQQVFVDPRSGSAVGRKRRLAQHPQQRDSARHQTAHFELRCELDFRVAANAPGPDDIQAQRVPDRLVRPGSLTEY